MLTVAHLDFKMLSQDVDILPGENVIKFFYSTWIPFELAHDSHYYFTLLFGMECFGLFLRNPLTLLRFPTALGQHGTIGRALKTRPWKGCFVISFIDPDDSKIAKKYGVKISQMKPCHH